MIDTGGVFHCSLVLKAATSLASTVVFYTNHSILVPCSLAFRMVALLIYTMLDATYKDSNTFLEGVCERFEFSKQVSWFRVRAVYSFYAWSAKSGKLVM